MEASLLLLHSCNHNRTRAGLVRVPTGASLKEAYEGLWLHAQGRNKADL